MQERWKEMWELPDGLLDLWDTALKAEVAFYIGGTFGVDPSLISDEDMDHIIQRFAHEMEYTTETSYHPLACRAFVWWREFFDRSEIAVEQSVLAEWTPCQVPYNFVDFDVDPDSEGTK